MIRSLGGLAVVAAMILSGCAGPQSSGGAPATGAAAASPRVQCLSDPHESGMRPLLFLFCIQSP